MSSEESVEFWKKQAKYYEQKVIDIQQELDEYTENSAQLEKELEASIVQVEKQNRDLEQQNQRLKNEIDMLRNKLDRSQNETNALEDELQALKIEKDKQAVYVRELEQHNDDLERGQRVISESVSYIEALLNQAYERNAVLESEVDEVENLRMRLQRATDEARDLKQELKVAERIPTHKKEDDNENTFTNGHISNSSRSQVETETQTVLTTPQKREINGNAMNPSSRVSAINIVGDLLRKVGLERFLCRDCGMVKCSCDATTVADSHSVSSSRDTDSLSGAFATRTDSEVKNDIQYRHSNSVERQLSNAECSNGKPPLPQRSSEQPFARSSAMGAGGKLRRSFIVRSREGIENLLSFSGRKNQETKTTKLLRP